MSNYYLSLLQKFPPRTIHNDEDFKATLDFARELLDQINDKSELDKDECDYLELLRFLILDYEQRTIKIPDIYGVELLKVLIRDRGLLQKDLVPIFKTESIVSDILNGKRQLTIRHIQELSIFFNLPPAAFLTFERTAIVPPRD